MCVCVCVCVCVSVCVGGDGEGVWPYRGLSLEVGIQNFCTLWTSATSTMQPYLHLFQHFQVAPRSTNLVLATVFYSMSDSQPFMKIKYNLGQWMYHKWRLDLSYYLQWMKGITILLSNIEFHWNFRFGGVLA